MEFQRKMRVAKKDIRLATVYNRDFYEEFKTYPMDQLRWLRMSESLANLGYKVDMIVNTKHGLVERNPSNRSLDI